MQRIFPEDCGNILTIFCPDNASCPQSEHLLSVLDSGVSKSAWLIQPNTRESVSIRAVQAAVVSACTSGNRINPERVWQCHFRTFVLETRNKGIELLII